MTATPTPTSAPPGTTLLTYSGHSDQINADGVVWSPDGKRIASASADSTVQVWDAATGKLILIYKGHSGSVYAVAWSPDSKRIASGGHEKIVKVWEAA